jgi:hypothetical protein
MIAARYILVIAVSILALLISIILDNLLAFLPRSVRFLIQLPVLVILIDEIRLWVKQNAHRLDLDPMYVDGMFFFAAPLAAVASRSLIRDIRSFINLF